MSGPAVSPATPEPLPAWITPELMAEAAAVYREMNAEDLTPDDILDLLRNLGGVFEFLYGSDAYDPQVEE